MHSSKPRPPTYFDVARTLNDNDVFDDINDACSKLHQVMGNMLEKFDAISKQMHTIDLLRLHPPFKPRWDALRKVRERRCSIWAMATTAADLLIHLHIDIV